MKNFQKLALSLMVGVMAIGFSAFTNAKSNVTHTAGKAIPAGYLVQVSSGIYEFRSSLTGDCETAVPNPCHYDVAASNNIPNSQTQWTKAQINTYSGVSNASPENRLYKD